MGKIKEKRVAAITGASSGFGAIYARRLAEKGYDLFLVARRESILLDMKDKLTQEFGVEVETMTADLAKDDDLRRVEARLECIGNLGYMVNGAGFGGNSAFPDVNVELETNMVLVHCLATMRLCRAALVPMVKRRWGRVINIASAAGFLNGDRCADYCATKAYIISLSKSIQCDVSRYGVRIQALCPGFVRTGFHDTETMKNSQIKQKVPGCLWTPAEFVVRRSLSVIERPCCYRVVYIPSLRYKLLIYFGSEWIFSPLRMLFSGGKVR